MCVRRPDAVDSERRLAQLTSEPGPELPEHPRPLRLILERPDAGLEASKERILQLRLYLEAARGGKVAGLGAIRHAGYGAYYWCLDQAEIATDVMFKTRPELRASGPTWSATPA